MTAPPRPAVATLVAVTRLLAAHGAAAAAEALQLVHDRLDVRTLTLRTGPGGLVIARAPALVVVPAQRRPREQAWVLDVPVRQGGATLGVLTATSDRPLSTGTADLLGALADVLALALAARPTPYAVSAQAVLDGEADRAQLAADLDERLRETLVALLHTQPAQMPTALAAALASAREIARDLRATSMQGGLRQALRELARAGASVRADDASLDLVAPAVAVVAERVAEAATRGSVETARIMASVVDGEVKLRVESADNAVDASELERWARRAHALCGELRHWPGGVELSLPAGPTDEGRHDHGPHL